MTKKLPATEAMLRRAISAARKEGLRVVGIRISDGTVLVDEDVARSAPDQETDAPAPDAKVWGLVEA
jgi:hypothetical protein